MIPAAKHLSFFVVLPGKAPHSNRPAARCLPPRLHTCLLYSLLHAACLLHVTGALGPESLVFKCHGGGPYTDVVDGQILKWEGDEVGWTLFAVTSSNRYQNYNFKDSSVKLVYVPQPHPRAIASLSWKIIVKVACGTNHTVAVDKNGFVYFWRFGGYGRTAESEASLILSKPIMQKTIDYLLFLLDQSYVERAIQMTLETRQIPEVLLACDVA
ncbi:hypothetical protein HN873_035626, partial [Arachis hypogaea]